MVTPVATQAPMSPLVKQFRASVMPSSSATIFTRSLTTRLIRSLASRTASE
jgi:hypothetical protein